WVKVVAPEEYVKEMETEVGGFVGTFYNTAIIKNAYAVGSVAGNPTNTTRTGSFAGEHIGTSQRYDGTNFFDSEMSNVPRAHGTNGTAGGATSNEARPQGRTTEDMMQQARFTGWDFANIWNIDEGQSYPSLRLG
ncbi:MAG: hypothetical protein FWE99_07170, partial [Bacteroidales bacterium]|nr:hypothetical protein [Bacteroidales bacterium]